MIHQLIVLVSAVLTVVSVFRLLITNDVPAVLVPTQTLPIVPAADLYVRNISLLDVTAVVLTVTVPAANVADPILAFVPVAIFILLPSDKYRFPASCKILLRSSTIVPRSVLP